MNHHDARNGHWPLVEQRHTSYEACCPRRRPLVSLAMVYSFKFYISAITLAVVGLSQPGWEAAHALTHGHELEHHGGAGPASGNSVATEEAPPGGHDHPQLGRAVAGKGIFSSEMAAAPLAADGFQPLAEAPVRKILFSAKQPRAGPRPASTSRSRAPPIV